jgi:ribulose-5-phosphate 4-epimerase/fuculose-1-phosphate aldolase
LRARSDDLSDIRTGAQIVTEISSLQAIVDDLVIANHVLVRLRVLDGFGHVSARSPQDPNRYLISRLLAPASVQASDIMELDLDSNPVDARGRRIYNEAFIHGAIYQARADVRAIVHSHSPSVIPFSVSTVPFRAVFHNASFLGEQIPVFEIRDAAGENNAMLVTNNDIAKSLSATLGNQSVVLMRGHGDTVVGSTIGHAVFRAYYTEVNARLQMQAVMLGGGVTYLNQFEVRKREGWERNWELWKGEEIAANTRAGAR